MEQQEAHQHDPPDVAQATPLTTLSYRRAESAAEAPDNCYRCGFPLLGVTDEQPCPACGLLARRSRRTTDELHDTRPRWLARISRGADLILVAVLTALLWPFVFGPLGVDLSGVMLGPSWYGFPWLGMTVASALLLAGALLLTSREGYPPADRDDRTRRALLRAAAAAPLLAILLAFASRVVYVLFRRNLMAREMQDVLDFASISLTLVGLPALPLLLFLQLRGLAKRARSAHLAEHCLIVGIGTPTAIVALVLYGYVSVHAEEWGFGAHWNSRSPVALGIVVALAVAASLFALWSVYLFVRFAAAFRKAAAELNARWTRDDATAATPTPVVNPASPIS